MADTKELAETIGYVPKDWVNGETIYEKDLNHIEQGIVGAYDELGGLQSENAELAEQISELNSDLNYSVSGSATSDFTLVWSTVNRVGNVVNVRIRSTDASISGMGVTIATLPEEFRPSTTRYISGAIYYSDDYHTDPMTINTDGTITQDWTSREITKFCVYGTYMI